MMSRLKRCPICEEEKPLSEYEKYWSKPRQKYRPQGYCRECMHKKARERSAKYYEEHKEERLEYAKKYRQENKAKLRKQKREFKRKYIKELKPCYVADLASDALGVPQRVISQDPELVKAYANLIRIKRKIKDAKE